VVATESNAQIIPFGKYQGQTIGEVLVRDPQYADWLASQAWFAQRFAELHAAILSRGAASEDTPEHNAIQARFLDASFRIAFLGLVDWRPKWRCDRPVWPDKVSFELHGIDVVLHASHDRPSRWLTLEQCGPYPTIEIKPSLGDDYPAVMRQMQRLSAKYLVVDQVSASLPLETIRAMFAANGQRLVTLAEIEAELAFRAQTHLPSP
jgi:hypothetical protein